LPALQILLLGEILIACDHVREAGTFRHR
jgi:hypothetical protein